MKRIFVIHSPCNAYVDFHASKCILHSKQADKLLTVFVATYLKQLKLQRVNHPSCLAQFHILKHKNRSPKIIVYGPHPARDKFDTRNISDSARPPKNGTS